MPTAVILAGAALLVLGALMAARRHGSRRRPDGIAGAATYTDGSTGGDCTDGGGSDGGCGDGGSGGSGGSGGD